MWLRGVVVTRRLTSGHLLCGEGNYPIFELYKSFHSQCSKLLLNIILNARFWMRKSIDVKTFLRFFFIQGTFFYVFNVFLFCRFFIFKNVRWKYHLKSLSKERKQIGSVWLFFLLFIFYLGMLQQRVCLSVCLSVTRRYCIETDKDIISKNFLGLLTPSPHMVGYNKNVLYLRPITLAKRYLRFYRCHGPHLFDKTSKFFIFN